MAWSFNSERPIFLQIADRIRADIICARYGPGDKIPSVRELAAEASVNPNTMQRALAELEAAGLVSAQRTAGRFVTQDAGVIAGSRDALARELASEYISRFKKLGFGTTEAAELIKSFENRADKA